MTDTTERQRVGAEPQSLGFGARFTRHLVTARYADGAWSAAELVDFEDLRLSPAALVMHYGQAIFEGLKAFRADEHTVMIFRAGDCAARFRRSAVRMAMPPLPEEMFTDAVRDLVTADAAEVPGGPGTSLYVRPVMFADEPTIAVRSSTEFRFLVLASPVDSFFASGRTMIDTFAVHSRIRAAAGGTGDVKCAGNYAGAMIAKSEAIAHGCDEVLWLDAQRHADIEEFGAMNCFVVRGSGPEAVLITPPLGGTILAGNTRATVISFARRHGIAVAEQPVPLAEVLDPDGGITEVFAAGTAAGVAPIRRILCDTGESRTFGEQPGPVTAQLAADYRDVVRGRLEPEPGWITTVRH